jgi:hypothetical protein
MSALEHFSMQLIAAPKIMTVFGKEVTRCKNKTALDPQSAHN